MPKCLKCMRINLELDNFIRILKAFVDSDCIDERVLARVVRSQVLVLRRSVFHLRFLDTPAAQR